MQKILPVRHVCRHTVRGRSRIISGISGKTGKNAISVKKGVKKGKIKIIGQAEHDYGKHDDPSMRTLSDNLNPEKSNRIGNKYAPANRQ